MEPNYIRTGQYFGQLLLALLILSSAISMATSKPVHPELEAVDICIFTCDFCFTGEALLRCANDCIMFDGMMSPLWRRTCPYFGEHPVFSSAKIAK